VELSRPPLLGAVLVLALGVGPWLARVSVRLAARDERARPSPPRVVLTTALFAGLLAGAVELTGARPATAALAWAAGAAVVLGAVDLASHRLPDRVTYPAAVVCAAAFVVDAAVLGWFWWGVLLAGVFLGLLTGGLVSVALLATRRAGWRTALPFGPPLMAGAVLALALGTTSLG
jgi:leader peptidase (prepilin peptidase)/N-methyltransferase